MISPNPKNLSTLELSKFLENEANNNPAQWKPVGYISYYTLIEKLKSFLYKKAKYSLTTEQYLNIIINANLDWNTGTVVIDIKESQRKLPAWKDTRLAIRPRTEIVIWTGKIL
jgi:hypothetical protein